MKLSFFLLAFLVFASCSLLDSEPEETVKFVEVISDYTFQDLTNDSIAVIAIIDGPGYQFDAEKKKLVTGSENLAKSAKYLLGNQSNYSGGYKGHTGVITTLSRTPYETTLRHMLLEKEDALFIAYREPNFVVVKLNDTLTFALDPGQSRSFENNYLAYDTSIKREYKVTRKVTIVNNGVLKKSDVN